ncbi:hypothetical protein TRIP_B50198 [uncultured Desulfatiglans sp.]|nr:hypothetical protein TRIP_B50198 [uncultured Desulfatiglans sp.]
MCDRFALWALLAGWTGPVLGFRLVQGLECCLDAPLESDFFIDNLPKKNKMKYLILISA